MAGFDDWKENRWEILRTAVLRERRAGCQNWSPLLEQVFGTEVAASELAAALGQDYLIAPDLVITRTPETDEAINKFGEIPLVDLQVARKTGMRFVNDERPVIHASISCKLTMRSDRAQNSRSEALNLIRNRKGKTPHIVVVTAEPLPSRLSSLALGTGDIDCVYHIALPELLEAVKEFGGDDSQESLKIMVDGGRLRDIADLPFDLAL